ncbi:response regulator [Brevibacillus humidisoli]|uniref:response regulator n=1 Tax=Brevibacillus humidisoli TaxID=2895522 RepID=UPI001E4FD054|nr:response regulator [Brevibacillus humidisoli]UFJ41044.1 response regulator [Brevibacillus humidisoli]
MRAILVDDERLALNSLGKLLQEVDELEIVGKYQDPRLALEEAVRIKPDVVFLDVEMPGLNGIDAAERLLRFLPNADVVFVTGFDEYAVKAFELNVLDYILKPVRRDRLVKTVHRIVKRRGETATNVSAGSGMIRCFQSLQYETASRGLEAIRWRTAKAQELFAYLLYRRGQPVRKDALLELFWPDTDWKKGFTQLYTTVYQIRKTLEALGTGMRIDNCDDSYLLILNDVKLDVEEWEREIRKAIPITAETLHEHLRLLELYRGDYLADYDYLWAESERERLRALWLQHALQLAEYLIEYGKFANALAICHRIIYFHPHVEEGYFTLMRLYDRLGDRDSVEQQYHKLVKMLEEEFGAEPHPSIQQWFRLWKKEKGTYNPKRLV